MPACLRSRPRPPGRRLTARQSQEARKATVSRLGLAAFLVAAGLLHFVIPRSYERIVPRPFGHAGMFVAVSGVAEMVAGALVAVPRTRRLGAWMALALFVGVWPANFQMALDGGIEGAGFPAGSPVIAWLRVPLQVPLFVWAFRLTRPDRVRASLEPPETTRAARSPGRP